MASKAEKIGAALGKAVRRTADQIAAGTPSQAPAMYRTNIRNVPPAEGFRPDDGRGDTRVQFLIDKKSAGADHVVGWTVLKPGARHERHRHRNCDEFFIVLKGHGHVYGAQGEQPAEQGDVVYAPRGCWHGFANTSNDDVVLVWGWMDAGSLDASGYEMPAPPP